MFFILRKLVKFTVIGLALGGAYLLIRNQDWLRDAAAAFGESSGEVRSSLGQVTGQVKVVHGGGSFDLGTKDGRRYRMRLTGLMAGSGSSVQGALPAVDETAVALRALLSGHAVRMDVRSREAGGWAGFAFVGETNVNLQLIGLGKARVDRNQLGGLSFREKYALLRANRLAKRPSVR